MKDQKNNDLLKQVELLEANPHYALIKDQSRNTKIVSTQHLAPYPRREVQNSREEQMQDYDELVLKAASSKLKGIDTQTVFAERDIAIVRIKQSRCED